MGTRGEDHAWCNGSQPSPPGWVHFTLFYDHYRKREYEQALETTKRWGLGISLAAASAWDEAIEKIGRAVDGSSRAPFFLGMLAWTQAASGRRDQARQTLGELERRAATEYVSPIALALALSELGDSDQVRTLLGRALDERASMLALHGMPCFRQLRAEPLMEDLRRRLLGEEHKGKSG